MESKICCIECGREYTDLPKQCSCGRTFTKIIGLDSSIEDFRTIVFSCHEMVLVTILYTQPGVPEGEIQVQVSVIPGLNENQSTFLLVENRKKARVEPNNDGEFNSFGDFCGHAAEVLEQSRSKWARNCFDRAVTFNITAETSLRAFNPSTL